MLSFIDCKLCVIKQVHKEFMSGLDVIITSDFCEVFPIPNLRIFKSKPSKFNIFGINFWHENIKCYESINILNRFWTLSQTTKDITFINKFCYRKPPINITLPHLFYINAKIIQHNKNIFENTSSETFAFFCKMFILKHVPFILDYQQY
jgi:hypothetical protein